jgi:tetratricopeptide (TPR) repeat protein
LGFVLKYLKLDAIRLHLLIGVVLIALSLAVYLPSLQGEFMYSWDDQHYVTDNYRIISLSLDGLRTIFSEPYFGTYIPITTLSYAVDYYVWGLNPYGYHLTNLVLHTANAVLAYVLLFIILKPFSKQSKAIAAASIGALLFLIHPIQVEVVVWVSQRKALLGLFFTLLAFIAHIWSTRARWSALWLGIGYGLFVLAVLSKAISVGAPISFIIYDVFWAKKSVKVVIARNIIPMLIGISAALGGILTQDDVGAIQGFFGGTIVTHIQVIFISIWDYVPTLVAPFNLNALYLYAPDETYRRIPETILGMTLFFGSVVLGGYDFLRWHKTRKLPLVLFTVVWVWAFYAPVSNIVPMPMLRADRYMYVPVIMLFGLVGVGVVKAFQMQVMHSLRWLVMMGFVVFVVFVVLVSNTIQHRDVWQNSGTLWQDHLLDYPNSTSGLLNLGVYYFKTGAYMRAQPYFEQILVDHPTHSKANEFMGNVMFNSGDYEQAVQYYQRAIAIDNALYSYYGLGRSLQKLGDYRGAFAAYQQAVSRHSQFVQVYPYYGEVALRIGERDTAITALETAAQLGTATGESYSYLCLIYGDIGEFDKAIENCEQSVQIDPQTGRYAGRYAHVLLLMDNPAEALTRAQQAAQFAPDDSLGFRVLGDAYRLLGDAENARMAYEQALRIYPDNALASEGLMKLER